MGKNKEEFMKDREQEVLSNNELRVSELIGELEEVKHLLSKSKTMIADMVMYNLESDMYKRYDDVMQQAQELLTELKEY